MSSILKGGDVQTLDALCKAKIETKVAGSSTETVNFTAVFRLAPVTEMERMVEEAQNGEGKNDSAYIREYLETIKPFRGAGNQEVEFSDELLDEMLDIRFYKDALWDGFMQVQKQQKKAQAKNS